jgi:hypothetical protein
MSYIAYFIIMVSDEDIVNQLRSSIKYSIDIILTLEKETSYGEQLKIQKRLLQEELDKFNKIKRQTH